MPATARLLQARPLRTAAVVAAFYAGHALGGEEATGEEAASCASGSVCRRRQSPEDFWQEMRRAGLRVKLAEAPGTQNASAPKGVAAVLSSDVFYGRPILRIPRRALISPETVADIELRRELQLLPSLVAAGEASSGHPEDRDVLGLAFALISEDRDPASVFREWLDSLRSEPTPPALELTERQMQALAGTTVEGLPAEIKRQRELVERLALNLTAFRLRPVSRGESAWALGVIIRRAQHVLMNSDVGRPGTAPRALRLVPLPELLSAPWHPDPAVSGQLEETEAGLLQVARRDMRRGEEAFLWTGRFSSSELALRLGASFHRNPTGIGGNVTLPPNWNPGANTPHNREYRKYNCTAAEVFEIRLSPKGWPGRMFVRCSRIAWYLANGWYKPEYTDRIHLLDKWPPPVKYNHSDWLGWTQADQTVNRAILEYCNRMKRQLKETLTTAVAEDFRRSTDPLDALLWRVRAEESKAFRECVSLARTVSRSSD